MTTQMNFRDWEALSAYLDDQLNQNERIQLEGRFKEEPNLRRSLTELDLTRKVLRSATKLHAPRNFTLSPEMAGIRIHTHPVPSFFSGLRLASILATFFFVLVTAGSLIVQNFAISQTVVQKPASQNFAAAPLGKGGGGGGDSPEMPAIAMEPTSEVMQRQMEQGSETPATLMIQVTPQSFAAPAAAPVQGFAEPRELAGTDEAAVAMQPPQDISPSETNTMSSRVRAWSIVTITQILLALLAIITGIAAFIIRRQTHYHS